MTTMSRWFGSALLFVLVTVVLLAQAPALDVRMGLWEITSTSNIGGEMPAIDTSKMTPAQKAQMEAAMKGIMGSHSDVTKSCMTKEEFDKSNFMMTDDQDRSCKQTFTTNTRTTLETNVVCTGKNAMTGQMHVDALSPTSFKANMKSSSTDQGRTMTMNVAMTGKWLGADCGDIK